jgi:hypothetical protein
MSEVSKFSTRQYQNVIGGGTEEWINMSADERKALRKGIATNLNIGLTFSPFGGGAAGAMNLAKVLATSLKNPKNAANAVKGLLNAGKNYFSSGTNIGKKIGQKGFFSGVDNAEKEEVELKFPNIKDFKEIKEIESNVAKSDTTGRFKPPVYNPKKFKG